MEKIETINGIERIRDFYKTEINSISDDNKIIIDLLEKYGAKIKEVVISNNEESPYSFIKTFDDINKYKEYTFYDVSVDKALTSFYVNSNLYDAVIDLYDDTIMFECPKDAVLNFEPLIKEFESLQEKKNKTLK